jgi:hypothetical protein
LRGIVSRTRCSVLHAAPQSRDHHKCRTRWAPDQQRTAKRCAASGARNYLRGLPYCPHCLASVASAQPSQ